MNQNHLVNRPSQEISSDDGIGAHPSSFSDLRIRPATEADLAAVVRVHLAAFPDSFYTALGQDFLIAFYGLSRTAQTDILLVAEYPAEAQTVGFVVGSLQRRSARQMGLKRLAWPVLRGVLTRPLLLPKFLWRALWTLSFHAIDRTSRPDSCELGPMAVAPDHAGRGVGARLVHALFDWAHEHRVTNVFVNTQIQAKGPDRLGRFYQRLGFKPLGDTACSTRRTQQEYVLSLSSDEPVDYPQS